MVVLEIHQSLVQDQYHLLVEEVVVDNKTVVVEMVDLVAVDRVEVVVALVELVQVLLVDHREQYLHHLDGEIQEEERHLKDLLDFHLVLFVAAAAVQAALVKEHP
jgi:hypothetical protein